MKLFLVLLMAVFGVSVSVYADTYQWVDDKGVVNFTDNPESIPKKYLKKVKVSPSAAPDQGSEASTPASSESSPPPDQATRNQLYGGHDEAWWRARYANLRGEIKGLQDNLPAKRDELGELRRQLTIYTYPRNREAYQSKLAEIQRDEARISELTAQIANLDAEAAAAAVPFDWRQ